MFLEKQPKYSVIFGVFLSLVSKKKFSDKISATFLF